MMTAFNADLEERPANPYLAPVVSVLLIGALLAVWQVILAGGSKPDREGTDSTGITTDRRGMTAQDVRPSPATAHRLAGATQSDRTVRVNRTPQPVTVYIAGSPEEARQAELSLNEANAVRAGSGEPQLSEVVIVAGTAEEARLLRLIDDAAALREAFQLPLPAIVVIDLRAP